MGDVVTATVKDLEQPGSAVSHDLTDELLDQASTKLADSLNAKNAAGRIADVADVAHPVHFSVTCGLTRPGHPRGD